MSFYRMGLGDEISDRLVLLQRAMHDLATAIGMAERTGQTAAAQAMRQQLAARGREVAALVARQREAESPSPFALGLANIGGDLSGVLMKVALGLGVVLAAVIIVPSLLQRKR